MSLLKDLALLTAQSFKSDPNKGKIFVMHRWVTGCSTDIDSNLTGGYFPEKQWLIQNCVN